MSRLTESRSAKLKCPETGQAFEWCSEIKGFGVRLTPGSRTYIVQLRHEGRSMRLTLGPVGILPFEGPPDEPGARDMALAALAAAWRGDYPKAAIGKRKDPAGLTLNQVWAAYVGAGYATGGAFRVGDSGGTDSQLVQFMATPSETVAVLTPSQVRAMNDNSTAPAAGGNTINQAINITATDAASFKALKRQIQMDLADAVTAAVTRTR